jgi:hypothetical protein
MDLRDLKPGDVLLYPVSVREKGELRHYYGCEILDRISDGRPLGLSGEPITGVRAIYQRNNVTLASSPERILLARRENDPDEKSELFRELGRIFGPGELVTGISCQCEAACSVRIKRL